MGAVFDKTKRWWVIAALLGATLMTCWAFARPERGTEPGVIADAHILLDQSDEPPTDDAPWQTQSLPDNWNHSRPGTGGLAWYRAEFDFDAAQAPLAIYINRASMNAAVYVNGLLIGSGGSFDEPVARNWNKPSFYVVPSPLLKPGRNVVHVRLRAYPRSQAGLSAIEVGPERQLREKYESTLFRTVGLNQLIGLFTFALATLFLLFWLRRRRDTVYLYFGLSMALWAVHGLKLYVRTIPVPAYYWDVFTSLIIPMFTAALVPFVFRFVGRRHPLLEIAGVVAVATLVAAHVVGGPEKLFLLASIGFGVSTLISAPLLWLVVQDAWRHPTLYRVLVMVAGAICLVLAVHDFLWQQGRLAFEARPLLQFGGPLLFLGMGGELLARFVNALTVAENANAELEARVLMKSLELAENYERLAELDRERAMIEERQRIMRDMHDGIGGHLITAISQVRCGSLRQDQLEAVLVEILDDLRLVIDSMQRSENDLASALGNFRYRIEPRLRGVGVTLDWKVDESVDDLILPPSDVLHVLRILQEAFTNVLKHSGASLVSVLSQRTYLHDAPALRLEIQDNGKGLSAARPGYGIANITERARAVGGAAEVAGNAGGTRLTLHIPYARHTDCRVRHTDHPVRHTDHRVLG
jgi:signal transduction histidine kinase